MTKIQEKNEDTISVAPMLDWTDTHFRQFLRLICHRATFYTEMIACPALIKRDKSVEVDPNQCIGCGMCANVCPKKCIEVRQ
jgi:tRNA-dihydrouridine synthase